MPWDIYLSLVRAAIWLWVTWTTLGGMLRGVLEGVATA
jgi:hypothetical protein